MKEKWKFCARNKNYKVSNFGRVKRIAPAKGTKTGKILKPSVGAYGYLYVNLCKNGKGQIVKIHRIVAEAFIGPCPKDKEVNHIDGDKENPHADNLEYVTHSENIKHSYRLGLQKQDGQNNGNSRLTESDVKKIRRLYRSGFYVQKELAEKFGVSQNAISEIINNKKWKYI